MRDHPVGMRQRPSWKCVGREPLMDQRQGALEVRIVKIGIVGAKLISEEHTLVDKRAARNRDRIIIRRAAAPPTVERARDRLAQNVKPSLEFLLRGELRI